MKPQASPKITAGTEPENISAARTGSPEAFAVLYNEHRAEVFRFIRGRVRDGHLAEDLTSETFIRALRRIDSFTWQGSPVGAWLITIARNLVADHFKSSRTRLEFAAGDYLDFESDQLEDSAENAGLRELAVVEARETVEQQLLALPPLQAEAIRLRYLDELTVAEAAAQLGRSVGATKQTTFRAFASMRARLAVAA
ncbi:RNA polymerase sigma factor [Streptomyces sp. NPDC087894]|uniref:RNA polymerase sigma factor n=1 Tax=Streptomyces sp. NPDC087894 TaxID=3365816 RepID=UPI003814432F